MSSSIQYNPIPPRVWSRVQNPCSVIAYKNGDPGANSDFGRANYERQMLLKGNILQYKKNSSSLTKKQRYTQIAKGMWTNRTKTWATQSDTYTNPNMTSLLRVNSSVLDPSNNTFSRPPNPFGCPTTEIQDGGNLVCNTIVDPCTQEVIKRTKSQQLCNPTTDSDVPGQIQPLCWNDGTQTWYPRQRYIMPTSGDKWPVNYKELVSALKPAAAVLILDSINNDSVTLSWTVINNICIPITSFFIYDNGVLVQVVPYPLLTTTIYNLNNCINNIFYVTSVSNKTESEPSNTVEAYINIPYGPTITSIVSTCDGGITITWESPLNPCYPVDFYTIYQDNIPTGHVSSPYHITLLTNCKSYSFYVTATFISNIESFPSNIATTDQDPCPPIITANDTGSNQVTITWTPPITMCNIISYTIFQTGYSSATYTNVISPYIINGLTNGQTYNFCAISVGLNNNSINSNSESVILNIPNTPIITLVSTCYKQANISWTEPPGQIISYYTIYQTGYSIQTITPVTTPYIVTGLVNGQNYNFTVSATNTYGIESAKSTIYPLSMPLTSSYFTGGSGSISGSNYIITFTNSGTLNYSCAGVIVNCSLLLVGGGGGGAGGSFIPSYDGGGGGGGGFIYNSAYSFSTTSNNIIVGNGGGGALFNNKGTNGGNSSFQSIIIGGGGGGGLTGTTPNSEGGNGNGNGGNGSKTYYGGPGDPGENSSLIPYSGGGGGGSNYGSIILYIGGGGYAGSNGIGGGGGSTTSPTQNGENSTTIGGGGGGGGNMEYSAGAGGAGYKGIVKITIPN